MSDGLAVVLIIVVGVQLGLIYAALSRIARALERLCVTQADLLRFEKCAK